MLLDGKVAIVTGASRGIGRAIATALAREGAKVVINHDVGADTAFGGDAPAQEALAAVKAGGGIGLLVSGDVADPATATKLVDAAVENFGGVDIHVSNAGICPFHSFLEMPADLYRKVIEVNLGGAFFTSQAARVRWSGKGGAARSLRSPRSAHSLAAPCRATTRRPRPACIP